MREHATCDTDSAEDDAQDVFSNLGSSLTGIRKSGDDPGRSGWYKAALNVTCQDTPGSLARFTGWIQSKYDINIIQSLGNRMDDFIHSSEMIIEIDSEQFERLRQELIMRTSRFIVTPRQPIAEKCEKFSIAMFGPDESGIFNDIGQTFTSGSRDINISSYKIGTGQFPETGDIRMALIEIRIEVPIRIVPSLPQIIDDLGRIRHGNWSIRPGDLDGSPGFSRLPIDRTGGFN